MRMTPTPAQRAWLEKLRDQGPQRRIGPGAQAHACRKRGWSCWMMQRGEERRPAHELDAEFSGSQSWYEAGWGYGDVEVITPAGLAIPSRQEKEGGGQHD